MTAEPINHRPALTVVSATPPAESAKAKAARETQERFLAKQADKAEKVARADARRRQIEEQRERLAATDRPRIELGSDPASIRALTRAIDSGILPDTYVRAGSVVTVETPSGAVVDDDAPTQVVTIVDPTRLVRLLADHTYTFEMEKERLPDGSSEFLEAESTPRQSIAAAALSSTHWDGLPVLHGIVTTPLFRPDGSLIQEPGYDKAAKVIYAPSLPVPNVPDHPTVEQLRAAKAFILHQLLPNFPWVGPSRANFIGALVAPLMRHYLGGALVPLVVIDATSPGTGKSLLALILTKIHSGYTRPWVGDDTELRKSITSILVDEAGAVVCLDNVGKGEVVDQPTLAAMLTASSWSDRILGGSTVVRVPNDRVWVVTGNSLAVGGDNASRSMLVRLDAQMANPDTRPSSDFALGDLEEWLNKSPDNRATVLHHLLVLMRGWIVGGANRIETPMRTFTPWASATAGFLDWLGERGFMTNRGSLQEVDEEEAQYGAFYARWHELFSDRRVAAKELHDSAMPDPFDRSTKREWRGAFLVRKKDGNIPSAVGLGKMLAAERGRYRGGYRLNGFFDTDTKVWSYSVTRQGDPVPQDAQ